MWIPLGYLDTVIPAEAGIHANNDPMSRQYYVYILASKPNASRVEKGLLAKPQKFKDWFPGEKSQIQAAGSHGVDRGDLS